MTKTIKQISRTLFTYILAVLLFSSCEQEDIITAVTDDDNSETIANIENHASLAVVLPESLPNEVLSVLEENYANHYASLCQYAQGSGYRVTLRSLDFSDMEEIHYAYFDEDGNELSHHSGVGRRPRGGSRDHYNSCFEIVFPIILTMLDNTTITLTNEEDRNLVKEWYEANPDEEDHPSIVYPIQISYDGGDNVETINTEEELEELKESCFDNDDDAKEEEEEN